MWMPLAYHHLIQGGKNFETESHDKDIVTVKRPIAGALLPAANREKCQKRATWTASFRGVNRGQDWL